LLPTPFGGEFNTISMNMLTAHLTDRLADSEIRIAAYIDVIRLTHDKAVSLCGTLECTSRLGLPGLALREAETIKSMLEPWLDQN
jgi:hypothetical protein